MDVTQPVVPVTLGLPQVINDVYWLRQQQEQCPQDALDKILGTWRDQEFASHARRLLR